MKQILDTDEFSSFLPMIYVAWADGELGDDEVAKIAAAAKANEQLSETTRQALASWLDPHAPPSAGDLQRVLGVIQRARWAMLETRQALAKLGADLGADSADAATRDALAKVERVLGVFSAQSAASPSRAVNAPTDAQFTSSSVVASTFQHAPASAQVQGKPLLDTDEFSSFLPMIYVAWADGELGDDEVAKIAAAAKANEQLSETTRQALASWLDPHAPPSAGDLQRVLGVIQRARWAMLETRQALAKLGADLGADSADAATRDALAKVERVLGVFSAQDAATPAQPAAPAAPKVILETPEFLPFLPMIYVAWADGELADHEIAKIQAATQARAHLSAPAQDALGDWLNPQAPPSATDLMRVLGLIQRAGDALPESRQSLSQLGVRVGGGQIDDATLRALQELEQALGVASAEVAAQLVATPPKPALPDQVDTWRELEPPAAFDVPSMIRALDGRFHESRQRMRRLLERSEFAFQHELPKDEYRELVLDWLQIICDEGIGRLAFPSVLNSAPDLGQFMASFETLACFDLSLVIKFGVQLGLFGGSIYFLGTEKHHALLDDAASLKLPGCFAMSELGHGSNVRGLLTTATYDRQTQEWIIHTPTEDARKEWIGNAACHARMATVFAQLVIDDESYGVHALLVPIRDERGEVLPGVFIDDCGHKMGLNGVDNGRLWFDQVRVPADNLLDRFAKVTPEGLYESPISSEGKRFFTMLSTLVGGRVSIAAAGLTASKVALTIATRYGAMRRQFGPAGRPESPILDFRTHQLRLMPLIAEAYALNFGVHYLQERYLAKSEEDEREVEALAAGLKAVSSWHATASIQVCRECCGGQGYLSINRFAALKADTDIFTTFEGDNTVLMQLVARSLLSDYGQQFQDFNFVNALRFVARQTRDTVAGLDFITARRTGDEHLRDGGYHLELLRYRERSLVASGARRFKRRLDSGMDSFDALIEVQDHLMSCAHAHMERVLLEQFVAAVEACKDPALATQLDALCDLYALSRIQRALAWFMENGLIESSKARAIRDAVSALCVEVRQQAVHLVQSFAIPEPCIAAPIARSPIVEPRQHD